MSVPLLEMTGICKTYPGGIVANDDASLSVEEGTIHAVIGENGAGKSTLMDILYGKVRPDVGQIKLRGEEAQMASPSAAIHAGIGMVSQHTSLIPALSVIDNVFLGAEPSLGFVYDRSTGRARLQELADRLGIQLDWDSRASDLSVSGQQKAEIVKALYRGAKILILDEPTAALAPKESEAVFQLLHALVGSGATVLLVTHKLAEVKEHAKRVTVMRGGKTVAELDAADASREELLQLMLGHKSTTTAIDLSGSGEAAPGYAPLSRANRPLARRAKSRALFEAASIRTRGGSVKDVSFDLIPGETLGIAGIDGSGQREIAEAIVGLRPIAGGSLLMDGAEISHLSPAKRLKAGIAYIPEDRSTVGLIQDFTIAENMLLGCEDDPYYGGGQVLKARRLAYAGNKAIERFRIRAGGAGVQVRALSGGNQQKVVVARVLERQPKLLVAMQPTRGLDVESTQMVYDSIRGGSAHGMATILFSLDLDEIFALSDRVGVLYNGTLVGIVPREQATMESIGRMMLEGIGHPPTLDDVRGQT